MAPTQPQLEQKLAGDSTRASHHKGKGKSRTQESSGLGLSKIKASLRQTRRLLAKDTLTPDVRVQTERRLKSLESDLEAAQRATKERTLAMRYHKVKFFERQKVLRKIHQVKRELASDEVARGDEDLERLQSALQSYRVDLNYILHYPKLEKYISLFPGKHHEEHETAHEHDHYQRQQQHMGDAGDSGVSKTNEKREAIRSQIKKSMKKGELSKEPEAEINGRKGESLNAGLDAPEDDEEHSDTDEGGRLSSAPVALVKSRSRSSAPSKVGVITTDDFFER